MITKATVQEAAVAAALAIQMWQETTLQELTRDFEEIIAGEENAVFLLWKDEYAVGFAQCQLRHDYVEGTETSPVGYLEGIFVAEGYRHRGYAAKLLKACETWTRQMGCTEFASDCELDNDASLMFHLRMGFVEANRVICFTKKL
ncbi:MAG: GNAT family N-acetyltransferase [Clostridiales bacterium]|nr:GNAT family N-acetyltransferase [Clostridiales bacterium]